MDRDDTSENRRQPALRVLLISPLEGLDLPGGDRTYTHELLDHPPLGVSYETHADAINGGRLIERGRRRPVGQRSQAWADRIAWWREHAINRLRARSLLFREPFRFFELTDPSRYDLIHVNVFSVRVDPLDVPLVISNGASITDHYAGARGWSTRRVKTAARTDIALARSLRVVHNSLLPTGADRLVCTSDHLRQWYLDEGLMPHGRVDVVSCGTEPARRHRTAGRIPSTVGFIATDFVTKGGPDLLAAWPTVRAERPDARLVIVGSPPRLSAIEQDRLGITWLDFVERNQLYDDVFPTFDVFAYPTRWDGAPLVVQEALGHGIPVVTSDYGALPEQIAQGAAGATVRVGDRAGLAAAIVRLLEPAANEAAGKAAATHFAARYDRTVAHAQLRDVYDLVMANRGRSDE